jgi:hypothetical protein
MSVEPLLGRVDGRGSETPFCLLWRLLANPQAGHSRCRRRSQGPIAALFGYAGFVILMLDFASFVALEQGILGEHAQHGADQVGLATVIPLARAAIAIRVS